MVFYLRPEDRQGYVCSVVHMIGKDVSADGGQQQWQMSAAVESDCGDGLGPPDLVDDWDGDGGGEDFCWG